MTPLSKNIKVLEEWIIRLDQSCLDGKKIMSVSGTKRILSEIVKALKEIQKSI